MNINDYTYHICDRFVLLFIAFIGLVGTSYILVSGSLNSSARVFDGFSTEFGISLHNKAINHSKHSLEDSETDTQLMEGELAPISQDDIEIESASLSIGE